MDEHIIRKIEDWSSLAKKLLADSEGQRIFAFYGKMGVGKTAFIKCLCAELGADESEVASPTFAIVNEYRASEGEIYHFDFYRIKDLLEVVDLGFEEYIYSGSYCFMEWSELVEELLPESYVKVEITEMQDGVRLVNSLLVS
ncbi:MAG: tRNA (adenosine(37)-N6)-threonylcarbamoyltransferase complex ATPase subunit type 1 TsaE [Bacteroidales bacterium]